MRDPGPEPEDCEAAPAASAGAPSERTRFLTRLLDDQERGRLQPVESYVADFGAIADFVRSEHENLAQRTWAGARGGVLDALRPGDRIARFELVRLIGEGGMGRAWLARDPLLKREVVVKALRGGEDAGDPGHERLRREARVLSRLDHPCLSKVLDILEQDGRVFLVLPYYEGQTLAECIAATRASRERDAMVGAAWATLLRGADRASSLRSLLDFFADAADALAAAHAAGIVHRDIKPPNLIIQDNGRPVVLDFGMALPASDDRLTVPGEILGTPLYMSPEQIDGSRPVDARSDVYSLGVTLYEALTLVHPFAGQPGREATFHRILKGDPVPPRRHQPMVPRDLEAVVQKAMDRDPHRRYQTAEALADELRRVIALEPTEARPVTALTLWMRRATRRPRRLAAAAVLAVAVGAASWTAMASADLQSRILGRAEEARTALLQRAHEEVTLGLVLDWCAFLAWEGAVVERSQLMADFDAAEAACYTTSPPVGGCRVLLQRGAAVEATSDEARLDLLRRYERLLAAWPDAEPAKVWVHWDAARWAALHAGAPRRAVQLVDAGLALLDGFERAGKWGEQTARDIAQNREFWVTERHRDTAADAADTRGQGLLLRGLAHEQLGDLGAALRDLDQSVGLFEASGNVHRKANALAARGRVRLTVGETAGSRADAASARTLYEQGFTDPTPDSFGRPGPVLARLRDNAGVASMVKLQARAAMAAGDWAEAHRLLLTIEAGRAPDEMSLVNCDVPVLLAKALLRDPQARPDAAQVRGLLAHGRAFYEPRGLVSLQVEALCLEAELLRREGDASSADAAVLRAAAMLDADSPPDLLQLVQRAREPR